MIQLINLKKQASIDKKIILDQISNNIKNADFILGKNNNLLEDKISKYLKSKYCLTCSSGTDALLMSLLAIDIKPGDIVFYNCLQLYFYSRGYITNRSDPSICRY
jgi:UDP-2-acetamido-2-deoxy-ribo-hexuluronate aminotransferase